MKIRERIIYVSGGIYGQLGNVYAILHHDGYILIDAGTPSAYDTIVNNLHYWGIDEHEITHVLLTHGHDDHAGTASIFQKLGATIVVGEGDRDMLCNGNFGPLSPYQNHTMPLCIPDILIKNDSIMQIDDICIRIYTMPGHTNGTLLYAIDIDNDTVLFTGDMMFCDGEKGDIVYTGWKGDLQYDSKTLGESFAKLWALDLHPTIVLGGHGNPRMGQDAKDMIMIGYKYYLTNNR